MRQAIAGIIASIGLVTHAYGVIDTRIDFQISSDGFTWTSSTIDFAPGSLVLARALVTYTGTGSPVGLASLVFQPTVSHANPGDSVVPFVNNGVGSNTSSPLGVISGVQLSDRTSFGRVSPWGRSATSSTSALTGFFHTNPNGDGVNYLRIAQHQVTSWFGGPGNTSGGSGVPIAQLSNNGRTASDPSFNTSLSNIYVFKFGIQLSTDHVTGSLTIDAPAAGFGNYNSSTGDREVHWFANLEEATGSIRGTAVVHPVNFTVGLPTPGTVAVLPLLGVASIRRRRPLV